MAQIRGAFLPRHGHGPERQMVYDGSKMDNDGSGNEEGGRGNKKMRDARALSRTQATVTH